MLPHLLALYTGLSLDSKTRVTCLSFYWAFSELKTRVTCPYRYFYWAFSEVHTLAAKLKRLSPHDFLTSPLFESCEDDCQGVNVLDLCQLVCVFVRLL